MQLIKELNEQMLGIGEAERLDEPYLLRKAVRAVLFNEKNEIAFQHVTKFHYHKLPGGGVEKGETLLEALEREILEEVGCSASIDKPIGMTIEYRNVQNMIQISYCYFAKVVGEIGQPTYDDAELEEGHKPMWVSLDDAISLLKSDAPEDFHGTFIIPRDLAILETAKALL